MDEHPSKCWTNHHSILQYRGQWYLFYHHNDLSPDFDKNRSIRADKLFFNENGTIQKVTPTPLRVGVIPPTWKIQLDRYSAVSEKGVDVELLDGENPFAGWKAVLAGKDAWLRFDNVDFGKENVSSVRIRALSEEGSVLSLRVGKGDASVETEIRIPKDSDWQVVIADIDNTLSGIQNINAALKDSTRVEIDWIRFE